MTGLPVLALTQGDPAGIGPEILLALLADESLRGRYTPLLIAERAALETYLPSSDADVPELRYLDCLPQRCELENRVAAVAVVDPVGVQRQVRPGAPGAADAGGAMSCLDAGCDAALAGVADALVTAPVSKEVIARHHTPEFVGHTDYLARRCGLERYGRDYLMAFLAEDLRVALLTCHLPLREAIAGVTHEALLDALTCLHRSRGSRLGRLAVAGLNPHAGEGGLLGSEEREILEPAVAEARRRGVPVIGPESPDTVFARARRGEFDWVLALYHDQGLIAVKSAAFGRATNWTLGLPILRSSVDHGTAYDLAGSGKADVEPLRHVVYRTLELLGERTDS